MTAVEITRFRTQPGRAADVVAARPAMVASFREDLVGFVRAELIHLGQDEWVDYVVWESPDAYADSRAKGTTPAIGAFFGFITETISQESATLVDETTAVPATDRGPATAPRTVELTRFRTAKGRADELLAARPCMLASFQDDRAGFIDADLSRIGDDEWLDVVVWDSPEAYAASRRKGGNTDAIRAFFAPIAALVSVDEGTLAV